MIKKFIVLASLSILISPVMWDVYKTPRYESCLVAAVFLDRSLTKHLVLNDCLTPVTSVPASIFSKTMISGDLRTSRNKYFGTSNCHEPSLFKFDHFEQFTQPPCD